MPGPKKVVTAGHLGSERLKDLPTVDGLVEEIVTKVCTRCNEEKPFSEFGKHSNTKDGRQSWCKLCTAEQARIRREKNDNKYNRAYTKARYRAVQRLVDRHPDEFKELFDQEKKKARIKR